jgi:tetratricopeptide (TPR) repeat protein
MVTGDTLDRAKEALEAGRFEEALRLIAEARADRPDDPGVRDLFAATHLGRAIRLSNAAREARRLDLLRREIEYEEEFQDTPEAAKAFEEALTAIEEVLRVAPRHSKARMLKAALLFRQDRDTGRPKALEILRQLAADEPSNKQVLFTVRKIERPCERCGDTGFCSLCKGRGERSLLGIRRRCEPCYGRGICPVCGVL